MIFPQKSTKRLWAYFAAKQASVNCTVYLYQITEGGYVFDNIHRQYSNEKLIATFKNGERV